MNGAAPGQPPPSLMVPVFGMTCALVAALSVVYAGGILFLRLNQSLLEAFGHGSASSRFMASGHGLGLWFVAAIGAMVSITLAWRRSARPSTLAVNVGVLILALVLAYLAKEASWGPIRDLFQGQFSR